MEVTIGQVWCECSRGGFWHVINTTARMATIVTCTASGAKAPGFTLSIRKATLRRDYALHSQCGNQEKP